MFICEDDNTYYVQVVQKWDGSIPRVFETNVYKTLDKAREGHETFNKKKEIYRNPDEWTSIIYPATLKG